MGDPKLPKPIDRIDVVRVPRALYAEACEMDYPTLAADARFKHEPAKAKYPGVKANPETALKEDLYEMRDYAYFRAPDRGDSEKLPHLYYQGWTALS